MPASADWNERPDAAKRGHWAEARREMRPLAEQGIAYAQYWLGYMYQSGLSVAEDYVKALKWYTKAAEQGQVDAQYTLGYMYDGGLGVPQVYEKALKWHLRAAEQGHPQSLYSLGGLYKNGLGVPQDYVQAHKWYNLAVSMGNEYGRDRRKSIEKNMLPAQIAEAQKLANEWWAKHPKGK